MANNHNICQGEGLLKDGDGKEAISVFWDPLCKTPSWKQKVCAIGLANIMSDEHDPQFCFRFRKPERVSPWEGVLDGTKMPNTCVQVKLLRFCRVGGKQHIANIAGDIVCYANIAG